jgi:hypothetical protein
LLSSNSSKSDSERAWKQPSPAGLAPHKENVTVEKLLDGSFGEEDRRLYSDEEWYKKKDWWKEAMAKAEENQERRRKGKREQYSMKRIYPPPPEVKTRLSTR